MHEWFSMGGYSLYVWPAYGITFTVFALNIFISLREKMRVKKIIKHYFSQLK